ncbi:hypothetical protein B0J14DRAFT_294015 [Halenospora varia]|nr:hypothetical protein B0J14DRAFT_294015 [Halenospora varia]
MHFSRIIAPLVAAAVAVGNPVEPIPDILTIDGQPQKISQLLNASHPTTSMKFGGAKIPSDPSRNTDNPLFKHYYNVEDFTRSFNHTVFAFNRAYPWPAGQDGTDLTRPIEGLPAVQFWMHLVAQFVNDATSHWPERKAGTPGIPNYSWPLSCNADAVLNGINAWQVYFVLSGTKQDELLPEWRNLTELVDYFEEENYRRWANNFCPHLRPSLWDALQRDGDSKVPPPPGRDATQITSPRFEIVHKPTAPGEILDPPFPDNIFIEP